MSDYKTQNNKQPDNDSKQHDNAPKHRASGLQLYGSFEEGDIVLLSGLKSKSEWNGQLAKVMKYVVDKQRYHIQTTVNSSEITVKNSLLKEDNLSLVYALKYQQKNKQCMMCKTQKPFSKMVDCPICRSIFYCSNKCLKQHLQKSQHIRFLCRVYRGLGIKYEYKIIDKTQKLFEFDNIIASDNGVWLKKYGLLQKGIWKRCWKEDPSKMCCYGDLMKTHKLNGDPYKFWAFGKKEDIEKQKMSLIPFFDGSKKQNGANKVIDNWKKYYKFKGLSLKSPIAQFMSYPMTVYYALTKCIGIEINKSEKSETIVIHLVGVEIELDLMHLFKELLCLLRGYNFEIFCFGNHDKISAKLVRESGENGGISYGVDWSTNVVRFHVFKCNYERKNVEKMISNKNERIPNVLIGLNAGFEGNLECWKKAMKYIHKNQIPSFFSEYTVTTVDSASRIVLDGTKKKCSDLYLINPFRSAMINFNPVSRYCAIQNAFIYTMNMDKIRKK